VHYYAIEPWGIAPDDYRWSMLYGSIAAALGVKDFDPSKMTVTSAVEMMSGEGPAEEEEAASVARFDRLLGLPDETEESEVH
jgi:hypothetical protein